MTKTGITFRGVRHRGRMKATQVRVYGDGEVHDLPLRLDVVNHSPDGFEWGYAGSGPAQLALAMLLALGVEPERAALWHQDVKFALVVGLDAEWELRGDDVLHVMTTAEERQR